MWYFPWGWSSYPTSPPLQPQSSLPPTLYPSLIISVWLASLKAPIPHFIPYLSITLPSLMLPPSSITHPPLSTHTLSTYPSLSFPLPPHIHVHRTCTLTHSSPSPLHPLPSPTHHPPLPPLLPQPSHRA